MPPKDSGKMHAFVKAKHQADGVRPEHAPGAKRDFEEFKTSVPDMTAIRTRNQQSGRINADQQAGRGPQIARHLSDGQVHLWDTDVSDIGESSTTASVRDTSKHPVDAHLQVHNTDASGSEEDGSGSEEDPGEDLPADPSLQRQSQAPINGHLNQKQFKMMNKAKGGGKAGLADGPDSKYVQGDSYPSTTSGRPSVSEQGERPNAQTARHDRAHPIAPLAHQSGRQSGQRELLAVQSAQSLPPARPLVRASHEAESGMKQDGLFHAPKFAESSLEQAANAVFTFSKAQPPKQQFAARPPGQPRLQDQPDKSETLVRQQPISVNTAEQGSRTTAFDAGTANARHVALQASTLTQKNDTPRLEQRKESSRPRYVTRTTPVQEKVFEAAPEYEDLSEPDLKHEQPEELEDGLDYAPHELYTMDYRTLKNNNFDVDPHPARFAMPADQRANTLVEQLASVSTLSPADQATFFTTLDIDRWEEAGGWFLDRFGEVVSRLRVARQEKRKAARQFEEEIEMRHTAVSRKRKLTEDALSEMKASGAQVLQGTPKKLGKTK